MLGEKIKKYREEKKIYSIQYFTKKVWKKVE